MNINERRAQIIQERELEKKWSPLLTPMTYDELEFLNRMVVHRLKIMDRLTALGSLNRLKVGDNVKWTGSDGRLHTGRIIRLNIKTASIIADNTSAQWRVSPDFLEKI